jgi:hypothetical protein
MLGSCLCVSVNMDIHFVQYCYFTFSFLRLLVDTSLLFLLGGVFFSYGVVDFATALTSVTHLGYLHVDSVRCKHVLDSYVFLMRRTERYC